MPLGPTERDQLRLRTGMLVLVAGAALMVWAWGSWIYRSSVAAETLAALNRATQPTGDAPGLDEPVSAMGTLLIEALALVLIVLIAALVVGRSARRHFGRLGKKRAEQTLSSDTWSRHRLPDDESHSSDGRERD